MCYQKEEGKRGLYKIEHPLHKIFLLFPPPGKDPQSRVSREPRVLALACEYRLDFRLLPGSVFDPPLLREDECGLIFTNTGW